jgi:hypothetical protein
LAEMVVQLSLRFSSSFSYPGFYLCRGDDQPFSHKLDDYQITLLELEPLGKLPRDANPHPGEDPTYG